MENKSQLITCGGKVMSIDELADIVLPDKTNTYQPVPHYELVQTIRETSKELLRRECVEEHYCTTREGQRMFGLQTFGNGDEELGFSVAFRNSYDKSMSIGIALGFKVFICSNLAIAGEIKILRKHTKRVYDDIDQILVHTLFRKGPEIEGRFKENVKALKSSIMDRMAGFEFLGRAFGQNILSPRQMSIAANEWEFQLKRETPADAWQLYNSCTMALKSTPPNRIMEAHRLLHYELLEYAVAS